MKPIVTECDIYKIEKEENDVEPYGEKEFRKSNTNDTDFSEMNGMSGNNIDSMSETNDLSLHSNHEKEKEREI